MSTPSTRDDLRNVAIIAHVDHGKTTLVDQLLKASGLLRGGPDDDERVMDRGDLEKERGITILSKCTSVPYRDVRINLIDTPGHADFGGEVERILRMADGCLLLVDAAEGPRPQTRYVLRKALGYGLRPLVVINKIDRKDARPAEVLDEVFDLFCDLDASDEQLEFPVLYAAGRLGIAREEPDAPDAGMELVLDTVLAHVPPPADDPEGPLSLQITTLDHSDYTGRIAVGRLSGGHLEVGRAVHVARPGGSGFDATVTALHVFEGTGTRKVDRIEAGDLCQVHGLGDFQVGDTVCDPAAPVALPALAIDEPTLRMLFCVNDSPLAGREGQWVTSRKILDRLERELRSNVSLRMETLDRRDSFAVSGRGILQLGILVETMRREGYEFAVGKPEVLLIERDGKAHEPVEEASIEVPEELAGKVLELLGERRATVESITNREGLAHLTARVTSRAMIGLPTRLRQATGGRAVLTAVHSGYAPMGAPPPRRENGALVSMESGETTAYALFSLQERGVLFVGPGATVYPGMIVGESSRDRDITVNPTKRKHLTNIRAAAADEALVLVPPRVLSLEQCLEYVEQDELVEITPRSVRLRKTLLDATARKRAEKRLEAGVG